MVLLSAFLERLLSVVKRHTQHISWCDPGVLLKEENTDQHVSKQPSLSEACKSILS